MYTIIMNSDKSLVTSVKTTLYQREKLADKIQFLFPPTYQDLDLKSCKAILKYTDQGNVAHSEILTMNEELYKGKLRLILPVDTNLNQFAGDVIVRITFTKIDTVLRKQYVLHTGEIPIHISPLSDMYSFVTDESLEIIDQMVGQLDAKIKALDIMAETYNRAKADENNILQLKSNGKTIGVPVNIVGHNNQGLSIEEAILRAKTEAILASKEYIDNSLTIIEV